MEIFGYSERGIINSLFYEIISSQNNLQLFNEFLNLFSFPYDKINFHISDVKILIEQSFSDFGDADVVLLIHNHRYMHVVFIEGKVKTFQKSYWSIFEEFNEFEKGIDEDRMNSSNLFVQLYYKLRLFKELQIGNIKQLQNGVQFPKGFSKINRKIGNNKVVLRAVNQLKDYCQDAFFIALVPENISNLQNFYQNILKNYNANKLKDWNIKNWGYITWEKVEDFCDKYYLKRTLKNFEFNQGQIYNKDIPPNKEDFF